MGHKKIVWSKDRPRRPDVDPMLGELRALLALDKRNYRTKADRSGLAPSTIKKIEDGTTRRPMGTTVQMAYAMLGYRLTPVRTRSR
jgi:hypothetical protein